MALGVLALDSRLLGPRSEPGGGRSADADGPGRRNRGKTAVSASSHSWLYRGHPMPAFDNPNVMLIVGANLDSEHGPWFAHADRSVCACFAQTSLVDEAVDGLVGVVLIGRVGQVGEDVRLVDHGALQLAGRAGVEHAARKPWVGDAVDESLCAYSSSWEIPRWGMMCLAAKRSGGAAPEAASVPVVLPGLTVMKRRSGRWRARWAIHKAPMYLT